MNNERFKDNFIGKVTKAKQPVVDTAELHREIDKLKDQNQREKALALLSAGDITALEQILQK